MQVVHYHFGKDGGAERFFVQFANALARRGVYQSAIIRPDRAWRADLDPSIKVEESHFRNLSPDRFLLPIRAARMARRLKPDALMAWAPRASMLMPAYPGCIKLSRLGDYPPKLDYFRNSDMLVCNTPGIADHVRKLGWTRGLTVISNFTDTQRVAPTDRAQWKTPQHVPLIVSLGRFVHRKGFHTLIEAVARHSSAYLWLAGEGEEQDALTRLAREKGLGERIRFLGWQKDARPFIAAADVFVMPSLHEPLGNVILEAWAQRRPVVSSRSEGPSWFMRDGENGLLAEIENVDSFSAAIEALLADPALAARLAEGGHRTLLSQFSEEAVTGAYLDLFSRRP
ncbi:glycosyl transferase [Xaviernesmea oryzae]|uniref:Glycosyl transferase n=1 Tax=Xaviernesmea oryzae TaxID=464029 RepID=A0A1Q9AV79_9HYPH|nr:glycosyltransferase [Xaviernesmea oryzae]OLP59360.1 glycosyl transferase [Xaviernesmea oryzae]SEL63199.1 Glycosyltransferase involved in cell wall bisynthesis [Xaviernesmea oryzae]